MRLFRTNDRTGLRRWLGLSMVLAFAFCGCASQAATHPAEPAAPTAPSGMGQNPDPPEPECKTDAECHDGLVCKPEIRAACPACDGGPIVHVCRPS